MHVQWNESFCCLSLKTYSVVMKCIMIQLMLGLATMMLWFHSIMVAYVINNRRVIYVMKLHLDCMHLEHKVWGKCDHNDQWLARALVPLPAMGSKLQLQEKDCRTWHEIYPANLTFPWLACSTLGDQGRLYRRHLQKLPSWKYLYRPLSSSFICTIHSMLGIYGQGLGRSSTD